MVKEEGAGTLWAKRERGGFLLLLFSDQANEEERESLDVLVEREKVKQGPV